MPALTRTDNLRKLEPMIEGIELPGESLPEVPILALSVHDSDDQVFAALCAGAAVYWLTSSPPAHLLDSLRQVASGGAPMSPAIAGRVVAMFRELRRPAHADYRLTPQESTLTTAARRRPPQEDGGKGDGHQRQHRLVPLEENLRKAPGPLQDRSGGQSAARAVAVRRFTG